MEIGNARDDLFEELAGLFLCQFVLLDYIVE
jgi:hypothetical protein